MTGHIISVRYCADESCKFVERNFGMTRNVRDFSLLERKGQAPRNNRVMHRVILLDMILNSSRSVYAIYVHYYHTQPFITHISQTT